MSLSALYEYYHTWVRTIVSSLIIKYILATATLFLLDSLGYSAGTVCTQHHTILALSTLWTNITHGRYVGWQANVGILIFYLLVRAQFMRQWSQRSGCF